MAIEAGAHGGRGEGSSLNSGLMSSASGNWPEPESEPRDWKKMVLVIGLGALSWAATYVGMLELIQANLGDLPLMHKILIGFSVAMLMTMIIWLLDQIFSPSNYGTKIVFIVGYLFLSVISVGFGFGFYWKVLESRSESTRSAESAIGQVQNSLHAGLTRMQQLTQTLQQVEQISTQKAVEEREKGTSCPNSRPGDGPRRKLRDADASSFRFASQFVSRRVGAVKNDMTVLDTDMKKVITGDSSTMDAKTGTRNDFLRDLNRRLDLTVTGFNAFRTDPQLRQIRADLNDRAGKTVFPNGHGGTFTCPDPQLQAALRGVVRAIDQLPEMAKPQIAAVEGSEATIEAFRRLTASITGLLTLSPPLSPDELRQLQKKAIQSVSNKSGATAAPIYTQPTGLGKRDYVPLAIAIFVDLCLLLVSIGRPMNRLNNLLPKMREAERGPVIQILSRFNEIHRDPEIRQSFEVFRHVVFDYLGDYYVAVPLDTPYNRGRPGTGALYGSDQAQELQHEAHLLANLFTSFEQEKIFKRVYFMPTRTVRTRLQRQGSKFAGSCAFRLYRFKEGAWSDIILGAVMGAAKRVEAEKQQSRALEEASNKSRGPTLEPRPTKTDARRNSWAPGRAEQKAKKGFKDHEDLGEAAPERKIPSYVLNHRPGGPNSRWTKNGRVHKGSATNGTLGATGLHGDDPKGFAKKHANDLKSTSEKVASMDASPIIIEEDFDDDELDLITAEDEQQIRSRYGKYADKILAERTQATHRQAARQTSVAPPAGDKAPDQQENPDLTAVAANSNTLPAATRESSIKNGHDDLESTIEAPKVIWLPAVKPEDNELSSRSTKREDASASAGLKPHNAGQEPSPIPEDSPLGPETTVTLTRETATYTVPNQKAVVPPPLKKIVSSATPDGSVVLTPKTQEGDAVEHITTTSPPQPPPIPGFSHGADAFGQGVETKDEDETVVTVAVRLKPELNS